MNSFDRSLLPIFSSEQGEHVERIRALIELLAGQTAESNPAATEELFRRAHTLKGAARAVGLEQTEWLIHRVEDVLALFRRGTLAIDAKTRRVLLEAMDATEDILAAALAERAQPDIALLSGKIEALVGDGRTEPPAAEQYTGAHSGTPAVSDLVRVNADYLDDVIRASSQLLSATAADAANESKATKHLNRIQEIGKEWERLRRRCEPYLRSTDKQSKDDRIAPLRHSLTYIDTQLGLLRREASVSAAAQGNRVRELHQQAQQLHESASRVRMTPAESVFSGFGPMVRDLAQQEGKQIEFRSEGLEWQADRVVLQSLKDPVMHLLRNAVSHGIEKSQERSEGGKPETGSILLRVQPRGNRLNVVVEDDGRGISRKALVKESRSSESGPLTLQPGFTTATMITSISGRGLGLSIVQEAVKRLQGEVNIAAGQYAGTAISITVPLTISTQHVLLMNAGGHTFGIPTGFVEQICRVKQADVKSVAGKESIVAAGNAVPLARLAELLQMRREGDSVTEETEPSWEVAVVAAGGERVALVVDRLVDEREAVIKDSGLPPSHAGLTAGAVPLEEGGIAVMLDVAELFLQLRMEAPRSASAFVPEKKQEKAHRILVVDDSLTTRSLEKGILEAHGYNVQIAVDGLQALEKLRMEPVDLVISDVMMPRLTGFQLLEQMKKNPELKDIPVILVTSLETREEQEKGLALGADAYIVKRKFDQKELLSTVRQIL